MNAVVNYESLIWYYLAEVLPADNGEKEIEADLMCLKINWRAMN